MEGKTSQRFGLEGLEGVWEGGFSKSLLPLHVSRPRPRRIMSSVEATVAILVQAILAQAILAQVPYFGPNPPRTADIHPPCRQGDFFWIGRPSVLPHTPQIGATLFLVVL